MLGHILTELLDEASVVVTLRLELVSLSAQILLKLHPPFSASVSVPCMSVADVQKFQIYCDKSEKSDQLHGPTNS